VLLAVLEHSVIEVVNRDSRWRSHRFGVRRLAAAVGWEGAASV